MSSPHPTITASFTGAVDLEGLPVPVVLSFAGATATLAVGDQEIGRWDVADVGFAERPDGRVEIQAEEDMVLFTPDDVAAFKEHASISSNDGEVASRVGFSMPNRVADDAATEPIEPASLLGEPEEPADPGDLDGFDSLFPDEPSDDGRPLIEPEDRADYDFAAGIDTPSKSPFPTPLDPSPITGIGGTDPEPATDLAAPIVSDLADVEVHEPSDDSAIPETPDSVGPEIPADQISASDPVTDHVDPPPAAPAPATRPDTEHGEIDAPGETAAPADATLVEERHDGGLDVSADEADFESAGEQMADRTESRSEVEVGEEASPSISELSIGVVAPAAEAAGTGDAAKHEVAEESDTEDAADAGLSRLARLTRRRRTEGTDGGGVLPAASDDPWARTAQAQPDLDAVATDDTPAGRISLAKRLAGSEPTNDRENLRQWGLVACGGLAGVVLLGGIAWGVASLLGSGDQASAAVPTPTTAVTSPANPDPPPATGVTEPTTPVTTVADITSGEDARVFVSEWNDLATTYSYGLRIGGSADTLPVSASVTGAINVRYDTDRVFTLTAAPQSNGADRDILVAMGMAIAWADPTIAPEGRRELLASLGVDVDEPQVTDMGGSLSRGGTSYDLQVAEGLIRFTVDPGP